MAEFDLKMQMSQIEKLARAHAADSVALPSGQLVEYRDRGAEEAVKLCQAAKGSELAPSRLEAIALYMNAFAFERQRLRSEEKARPEPG
jgi:hypothetical protein